MILLPSIGHELHFVMVRCASSADLDWYSTVSSTELQDTQTDIVVSAATSVATVHDMERQEYQRRVHDGATVAGKYTIQEMWFSMDEVEPPMMSVATISEYESGCRVHKRCFGHLCITPSGLVLPPQSMSMKTNEISTEYHRASRAAFAGQAEEYTSCIRKTNYTKDGTMRSIMSTPTAGSARLIATPHDGDPTVVYISENLASRLKVCKVEYRDGNRMSTYTEGGVHDGDKVQVDRPPALNLFSTPPFTLRFWKHECAGIHPEAFSSLHGDYDGDEIHIYPQFSRGSHTEHAMWSSPSHTKFDTARRLFREWEATRHICEASLRPMEVGNINFLEYTTLGASQILDGATRLALGDESRNTHELLSGTGRRFVADDTESNFVTESIRGMSDVCRQQLLQGPIGDMTRVAKIAASCFCRPSGGGLYVVSRESLVPLCNDGICDSGFPSMRAMSSICSVSQQAALDAHRATSSASSSHDMLSDLVLGCGRTSQLSDTAKLTVFQVSGNPTIPTGSYAWRYYADGHTTYLMEPGNVPVHWGAIITAAYNPTVLSLVKPRLVQEVCKRGITIVCNYYNVALTELELNDISYVYSYMPLASPHPITCRQGLLARGLGWIETLEATDITKITGLVGCREAPHTPTAAMFTGNFEHLKAKYDSYDR